MESKSQAGSGRINGPDASQEDIKIGLESLLPKRPLVRESKQENMLRRPKNFQRIL
jgi:hypothetical protein